MWATAILLCLCGALAGDQLQHPSLEALLQSKPSDSELPQVLRGENFTRANLIKWFSIVRVETDMEPMVKSARAPNSMRMPLPPLRGSPYIDAAKVIVNAGKFAWQVIKDGKPNYNENGNDFATATPKAADWDGMEGWQVTDTSVATSKWVNGFDYTIIDAAWTIHFQYGGKFHGLGAYITNAIVDVQRCELSWGINLNVHIRFTPPTNMGTRDYPVGYLEAHIQGDGGTMEIYRTRTWVYQLWGNGGWKWREAGDEALTEASETLEHVDDVVTSSITPFLCVLSMLFVGAVFVRMSRKESHLDEQPYFSLSA